MIGHRPSEMIEHEEACGPPQTPPGFVNSLAFPLGEGGFCRNCLQFRQKTDEVLLAGLQKPSPELYNSWISSRIRPSAVRVLTSGPHPTSQRCHVKIFDFAMAVPAKPGPASLKACRLARPPSPRGKAFCCLTIRGLARGQTGYDLILIYI